MSYSRKVWSCLGQGLCYLLFIVFIGYFSHDPGFTNMPSGDALIKLTFTYPGKRLQPCRKLTAKELAKLAPQLRLNVRCPRERSPLRVEFWVDGRIIYHALIKARGIAHDLPSPVYQRLVLPAGRHHLRVRMNANVHRPNFYYVGEKTMVLVPLQTVIVDFDNTRHQFVFE